MVLLPNIVSLPLIVFLLLLRSDLRLLGALCFTIHPSSFSLTFVWNYTFLKQTFLFGSPVSFLISSHLDTISFLLSLCLCSVAILFFWHSSFMKYVLLYGSPLYIYFLSFLPPNSHLLPLCCCLFCSKVTQTYNLLCQNEIIKFTMATFPSSLT